MLKKLVLQKCVTWKVKVPYVVLPSIKIFYLTAWYIFDRIYSFSFLFLYTSMPECVCVGGCISVVLLFSILTYNSTTYFYFFHEEHSARGLLTTSAQIQVNSVTQD